MAETLTNKNDEIVMKLLHYFITEQNYTPIILHGAQNEIWLENLDSDYKIVRIVSNYIHNNEQFSNDVFRTKMIMKSIKKKTLSVNINTLSIFINIGDNVEFVEDNEGLMCANIKNIRDLKRYSFVTESFPNIFNKTKFSEKGKDLFIKLTQDISRKTEEEANRVEDIFKPKIPIITYALIGINTIMFIISIMLGNGMITNDVLTFLGAGNTYLIKAGEYYRLISGAFLHVDIFHFAFNMYALYVIGQQIESFFGKIKYLGIYLFSALAGNLLSLLFVNGSSVGASGAIFGLLGSLLYFGFHYRIYLANTLKSQIIPVIILNLLLGFMNPNINVYAHIGGLVGGILITMALGDKYKSTKSDCINGLVLSTVYVIFLIYMGLFH